MLTRRTVLRLWHFHVCWSKHMRLSGKAGGHQTGRVEKLSVTSLTVKTYSMISVATPRSSGRMFDAEYFIKAKQKVAGRLRERRASHCSTQAPVPSTQQSSMREWLK